MSWYLLCQYTHQFSSAYFLLLCKTLALEESYRKNIKIVVRETLIKLIPFFNMVQPAPALAADSLHLVRKLKYYYNILTLFTHQKYSSKFPSHLQSTCTHTTSYPYLHTVQSQSQVHKLWQFQQHFLRWLFKNEINSNDRYYILIVILQAVILARSQ